MAESRNVEDVVESLRTLTHKMLSQAQAGTIDASEQVALRNLEAQLQELQYSIASLNLSKEHVSALQNKLQGVDVDMMSSIRDLSSKMNVASTYESARISTLINEVTKMVSMLRILRGRLASASA